MNVLLTFDVEVWCNGWDDLDRKFPESFARYIFGRSPRGEYGLPKTLEILAANSLKGVFFVEPLFAARFGVEHLARVVELLRDAGHEVQLHLHPEWTDEIDPPPIADVVRKRQHLRYYTRDEQTTLIGLGLSLLREAGCASVNAFRAGSFAANRDTFRALAANGIVHDSSFDAGLADCCPDMRAETDLTAPCEIDGVIVHPMTILRDGFGRFRHAQVGACSFAELRDGLASAYGQGHGEFVILSHSFEMLRVNSSAPDDYVVRRFERLCRLLAAERMRMPTVGFHDLPAHALPTSGPALPRAAWSSTARRYYEQAMRRF